MGKQYTVAVLLHSLLDDYQNDLWRGLYDEAVMSNIRLVTLMGGTIETSQGFQTSDTRVFSFVSRNRIDGLIIPSSVLLSSLDDYEKMRFFQQFGKIPILSIGTDMKGVSSILVDNYKGLFDLVNHLVQKHGYNRIAYIGGPINNEEAKIRYNAYADALKQNSIQVDDNNVVYGDFLTESGASAVKVMLEDRNISPQAIVCANDNMAFGAIKELFKRSIKVPDEIAVTGFDNIKNAVAITPSLTTVAQPVYENGKRAIKTMQAILSGKKYEKVQTVPTSVVTRQSCGCIVKESDVAKEELGDEEEQQLLVESLPVNKRKVAELFSALKADITNYTSEFFLPEFNGVLQGAEGDLHLYFTVLTVLRIMIKHDSGGEDPMGLINEEAEERSVIHRLFRSRLDPDACFDAETLLQQAAQLIAEKIEQLKLQEKIATDKESILLNEITSFIVSSANSIASVYDVLKSELPLIGITTCYISLVRGEDQCAEVKFALDPNDPIQPDSDYVCTEILPDDLWSVKGDSNLNVLPLYNKNDLYGFITFVTGSCSGYVYEVISRNISNAIKSIYDYEKEINRSKEIQSLVYPMLNLITEIVGKAEEIDEDDYEPDDEELEIFGDESIDLTFQEFNEVTIIGKTSKRIKEVMDLANVIKSISKGINILAINSSIQASQAGKYAKSFKAISEEIRRLSDTTAVNSRKIEDVLKNVSELMESIISKMTELSENSSKILHFMDKRD